MKINYFPGNQPGVEAQPGDWLSKVEFRYAKESDLRAIEWEGEYEEYRNVYADVFERTKSGLASMWLADMVGWGLIGQVFVQFRTSDRRTANGKTRAYVHSFRVRDAWRGQGLGERLMDLVEADLLDRGFREVTLNVAQDNEGALRLYQRLGYHIVKKIPGRWSYYDPNNVLKHIIEPGYRMMKRIDRQDKR
jgi:ribosomal protein S18 acetylase RimI-like enzyme